MTPAPSTTNFDNGWVGQGAGVEKPAHTGAAFPAAQVPDAALSSPGSTDAHGSPDSASPSLTHPTSWEPFDNGWIGQGAGVEKPEHTPEPARPVSLPSRAPLGIGGGAPYGFRWEGGAVVPDPAEQQVLAAMLDLARRGVAPTRIANVLNRQEVPTRHGRAWWPATVIGILRRAAPELAPPLTATPAAVPQPARPGQHRRSNRNRMRARRARSATATRKDND